MKKEISDSLKEYVAEQIALATELINSGRSADTIAKKAALEVAITALVSNANKMLAKYDNMHEVKADHFHAFIGKK